MNIWRQSLPLRTMAAAALGVVTALALPVTASAQDSSAPPGPGAPGTFLVAVLDGRNVVSEVPGRLTGDPNGQAVEVLRIDADRVTFAISWSGVGAVTAGHIHAGAAGVNGPVQVPLFGHPLPGNRHTASGTVRVADPGALTALRTNPGSFSVDLTTKGYPAGAVRGQLHAVGHPIELTDRYGRLARNFPFVASVRSGQQIYACTRQADGTFAYTQHNVSAHLRRGIDHSFVKDDAGPPQWVARDGSSVTGTLVSKVPHGDGNIAELDLNLTQTGAAHGLLAHAVEVQRINTVGGVAPAGVCDPVAMPIAAVPYQADYLFING